MKQNSGYLSLLMKHGSIKELRKVLNRRQQNWDWVTKVCAVAVIFVPMLPSFNEIGKFISAALLGAIIIFSSIMNARYNRFEILSDKSHVMIGGCKDNSWFKDNNDYVFVPAPTMDNFSIQNGGDDALIATVQSAFNKCDALVLFKDELSLVVDLEALSVHVKEKLGVPVGPKEKTAYEVLSSIALERRVPVIVKDDSKDKSTVIDELDDLKLHENAKRAKELYRNAFHAGVVSIVDDSTKYNQEFVGCLKNRCNELKILTTTGQGLIVNHKTLFEDFLLSGKDIYILIGLKNSPFLNEVGLSESTLDYSRTDSLNDETKTVLDSCIEIFAHASAKAAGKRIGSIKIAGFNTQFRSTIVLCELNDNSQWGWVTITLPPAKALGSVSLEFDSRLHSFSGYDAASKDSSLPTMAENHFTKVWNEAVEANRIITLDQSTISSIKKGGYPKELTYE